MFFFLHIAYLLMSVELSGPYWRSDLAQVDPLLKICSDSESSSGFRLVEKEQRCTGLSSGLAFFTEFYLEEGKPNVQEILKCRAVRRSGWVTCDTRKTSVKKAVKILFCDDIWVIATVDLDRKASDKLGSEFWKVANSVTLKCPLQ
jgi:hypothetical protein